jgi:D-aspartate ligase
MGFRHRPLRDPRGEISRDRDSVSGLSRNQPRQSRAKIPAMKGVGALVVGGDYRGLGIVRSLGRQGIPVWVVKHGEALAGYSRYAQRRLRWPDVTEAGQLVFLHRLAKEHDLEGWVLFPTTEETASLVSRNHAELSRHYRLTTSAWSAHAVAADKRLAYQRAETLGIDVPRTWYPGSAAEVAGLDLEFPVILKPAVGGPHNSLSDEKAWRVEDRDSLLARYDVACNLIPANHVMIQEVIVGGGEHQLSFAATCRNGEALAYLTARRTRQYPLDFGRASTFVETIDRPDLVEHSLRLLRSLELTGPVEVEYKHDPRDNRIKLLDVNARSWGWHSIGAAAGADFAHVAWREARGETVTVSRGRPGVRWVRLAIDLPVSAREITAGRMRLRPYLSSLRPPIEGPIAALDDPLPGLMDIPLLAGRAAKRVLRRAGQRVQRTQTVES